MKYVLFVLFTLFVIDCSAQSIMKRLPPVGTVSFRAAANLKANDSLMNAFRVITNLAAYTVPGNILMAGAGISYQHLKWTPAVQKWYCVWSVSAMGWAGGSVAPATPAQIVSYGVMLGLFNNLLMIGPALNGNKIGGTIALGFNLNN